MIPPIAPSVIANARQVWNDAIDQYGQDVEVYDDQGVKIGDTYKALCKRPKILGLFDRTQASYDQERYAVMMKETDVVDPHKFMRVRWHDEDHVVMSVTPVSLGNVIFGYRFLVKG